MGLFFVFATASAMRSSSSSDLAFVVGQRGAKTTGVKGDDSSSARSWRPIYAARMTAARGKNQLSHLLAMPRPLGVRHGPSIDVRKTAAVTSSAPAKVTKSVQRTTNYAPEDVFMATLLP